MRECAERLLGVTSGIVMVEKESLWWNGEVQEAIEWKKEKEWENIDWEQKKARKSTYKTINWQRKQQQSDMDCI